MRSLLLLAAAAAVLAAPQASLAAAKAGAAKGTSKMSTCASQWKGMSDADKGKYNDRAKTMKSKKGGKLSGYNVWTGECMKK
jgi:opacity protein-like surface antigen